MPVRLLRPWRGVAALLILCAASVGAAPPSGPLGDVSQVSVGRAHTCILDGAGAVACWGSTAAGQLGVGEISSVSVRTTPVPVPAAGSGNRSIVSGDAHTCVVTAQRGVRCWGLGIGTGSGSEQFAIPTPVDVLGLAASVESVAAGAEHSCARLVDGSVQCWGGNGNGQLGDGSTSSRLTAGAAVALGAPALLITAGGNHSCAVLANGGTRCWGANASGQLGDGSTDDRSLPVAVQGLPSAPRAIAAGSSATCAVGADGAVYCWGPQFPLAEFAGGSLQARIYPGFESGYRQVDGGNFHFCALRDDGAVRCLGDNVDGQLGIGPIDGSSGATFVIDLENEVTQIASGGWHSCARNARGGLQCWGRNADGQLGIDSINLRLVPTQVAGLDSGQASVAAGGFHTCGLSAAGGVTCWGANGAGQLGDGSERFRSTPAPVIGLSAGVRALEAGDAANCAITAARRVQCWGANFDGRLGNGLAVNSAVPVDVVGLDGDVNAIALGREHGCALLATGAVRCWGSNQFGQLGTGGSESSLIAVAVQGLGSGVIAIAAGYFHTCALRADGLRCWGNNEFGQLGDGSRSNRATPVAVGNPGGQVLAVEAGIIHTCALLQGGSVSCWGYADFGTLLGDGSTADRLLPGPVPALSEGVVQIALGGFHSCARTSVGAMRCWGQGGTIGDNSLNHRPLPVAVAGLESGVQQISAGFGGQTCAVVNGAARCWGENSFAQVGDGSTHGEPLAKTVLANSLLRRVLAVVPDADGASSAPQFAADGRLLVFQSAAANLVDDDNNGLADIFVLDRETGEVRRVSVDNDGGQLGGPSSEPTVSADGQLVAFVAPLAAPAVLLGESASKRSVRRKGGGNALFLRNLLTGSTQLVSNVPPDGAATPQLAASGSAIVFTGLPASTAEGSGGQRNVFLVPLIRSADAVSLGAPQCLSCKSTEATGVATGANADGESGQAVVSADGQWVAFQTAAANAIAGAPAPCPAGSSQILLRNMITGSTQRLSPPSNLPASACASTGSQQPSIDGSGQVVAFQSDQPLVSGDGNGSDDVYVWRADESDLLRASVAGDGSDAAGASGAPTLSGDGNQLVYLTAAPNIDLSFPDNNDRVDVHSVALADPTNAVRLSRTTTGAEANGDAATPALSFDGSEIAFASTAANLAGALAGSSSVFARSNPLAPPVRSATWWIPAESGWGLSVFQQGNVLAPAWFTYDLDGEPTWFLIGGAFLQPDGSYRGQLFKLSGTPYDRIQGPAVLQTLPQGEVSLRYPSENALQFDYQVGALQQSKTLRRFPYGPREFSCSNSANLSRADAINYTDLWTGADGGGWGLTLFHIDASLFAAWYTYDLDGEAVFFILATTRQADGSFAGSVFRQRDGTPFAMIEDAPPSTGSDPIGSARLQFSDGESGQFSFSIGGVDRSHPIERLQVGDRATVCRSVDAGAG